MPQEKTSWSMRLKDPVGASSLATSKLSHQPLVLNLASFRECLKSDDSGQQLLTRLGADRTVH